MKSDVPENRLVRWMLGRIGRRCQQDYSGTLRTGDVIPVSPQTGSNPNGRLTDKPECMVRRRFASKK
jgi:hypothetical protein